MNDMPNDKEMKLICVIEEATGASTDNDSQHARKKE